MVGLKKKNSSVIPEGVETGHFSHFRALCATELWVFFFFLKSPIYSISSFWEKFIHFESVVSLN